MVSSSRTKAGFVYLYEDDDVVGLEIKAVSPSDAGEYTCTAYNGSGEASKKLSLLVGGP